MGDAIRELKPDETYHLASASFVPASWEDPEYVDLRGRRAERSPDRAAARPSKRPLFNAASGEMFGAPEEVPQSERTPIAPITPYGAGKAFAHFLTGAFRRHYAPRLLRDSLQPRVAAGGPSCS